MKNPLGSTPQKPKSDKLHKAHRILAGAYDAASHFLELFENIRESKGKGTSTDREQDLLRAMLVFTCAGLDSMLKQLVRDALESVIDCNDGAEVQFRSFVEKQLSRQGNPDSKLLSELLTTGNPRSVLIGRLIDDLTSRSLQSKDEVLRAASYFDIARKEVASDLGKLEEIFHCRNQISHEMDIDFEPSNRNRRPRSRDDMIANTKAILQVAGKLLKAADKRLA